MDPKMDSGLLLSNDRTEATFDVLQELSPAQVLGIMDELLCFEVTRSHPFINHSVLILLVDVLAPGVSPLSKSPGLTLY